MADLRGMPRNWDRASDGIEPCPGWEGLRSTGFTEPMLVELLHILDIVFFDGTLRSL